MLEVGNTLEHFEMKDAFVDAWGVANKVSDLLLERMGREVCCAPFEPPEVAVIEEQTKGFTTRDKVLYAPQNAQVFFTMDGCWTLIDRFHNDFERYDFLSKFLDGVLKEWEAVNIVMGMLLGFKYDRNGNIDSSSVSQEWWGEYLEHPPNFENNLELREKVESMLASEMDEDKYESLEDFIEVLYGKAGYIAKKKNRDEEFDCRATAVKLIYDRGFLNKFQKIPAVEEMSRIRQEAIDEEKSRQRFIY